MAGLLGCYENFSEVLHGLARVTYHTSRRRFQQIILGTFQKLNREDCDISEIASFIRSSCKVSFEFGIAEGKTFTYLDSEETRRAKRIIAERMLPILDFLCVIRYHKINTGKSKALKFDYHFIRLTFQRKNMEILVFHERGPRRVSLEELIIFKVKRINEELLRNALKPLTIERLWAL